jgi:diaminohydroxyphosphoribosylaminopyrimidine deaminase/5-amino-6-(5-phosphoribosylamino)uracil reductase
LKATKDLYHRSFGRPIGLPQDDRKMNMQNIHEKYMAMAIALAKKAEGMTSPNPIVGAVIVKGGNIVGRGYHKKAGLPHAEINAIARAGAKARGATLYVTLEPCNHFGRTPPCTDAIINSGIRSVVAAMVDPNPLTKGRGIKILKKHGIKTTVGVLEYESRAMNRPFIKFIARKMPYVTVKAAQSIDGKIATRSGDSKWITGEDSRRYVHELRSKADAVMVGVNTVVADDPLLTARIPGVLKQPIRVIVDSTLKTPLSAKLFSVKGSKVVIATTVNSERVKKYQAKGAEVVVVKGKAGRVDLKALLEELAARNITNVFVEGGGTLNASLFAEGLVDRALFFIAPKVVGGRDARTSVEGIGVKLVKDSTGLKFTGIRIFPKGDILIEAEVVNA